MSVNQKTKTTNKSSSIPFQDLKAKRKKALSNYNNNRSEPLGSVNLLSRADCVKAIAVWNKIRSDYSKIEGLINPTSSYNFNIEECNWLRSHNLNSHFHVYFGVYHKNLILITVPLNKVGNEINLKSYLISQLSPLRHNLNLVEEINIKKVTKIKLSQNLMIENSTEEVQLPIKNEPLISDVQSLLEIQLWKNQCLNWFFCESNDFDGKRIFKTFKVPLADLVENIDDASEIYCLFGLKTSLLYNRLVPVLIFISNNTGKQQAEFMRSQDNSTDTNSADFDSPCPPFCRDESQFGLL